MFVHHIDVCSTLGFNANYNVIYYNGNNSSLNPYWNSNLERNWNIHQYLSFIHVPGISGKQGIDRSVCPRVVCAIMQHMVNGYQLSYSLAQPVPVG